MLVERGFVVLGPGSWIDVLLTELAIVLTDPAALGAIAVAGVALVLLALLGHGTSGVLSLVPQDATVAVRLGVNLAAALTVVAATWASLGSHGRSAFVPPAIAFLVAIAWAASDRYLVRSAVLPTIGPSGPSGRANVRHVASVLGIAWVAVAAIGIVYGVTMNPSPHDGLQPIPFLDETFYSVLARDLGSTGFENLYSPSGFTAIDGLPSQTWYHWGEMWLAAGVIDPIGISPMHARHYVVLPILAVASALMAGALVRVASGETGRWPFVFGAVALLVMAPLPLYDDLHFASWSRGVLFGITMYGLAITIIALVAYRYATAGQTRTRPQVLFDGALVAVLIPSHIVLAGLLGAAVAIIGGIRVIKTRAMPSKSDTMKVFVVAAMLSVVTVGWGLATDHGIGTSGTSPTVAPFNLSWQYSVVAVAIGGLPFWSMALMSRIGASHAARDGAAVALMALALGAVYWGARLGDFTSFHAFFAPLATFVTLAATVALVLLWRSVSSRGFRGARVLVSATLAIYLSLGGVATMLRLHHFGFTRDVALPEALLEAIAGLPEGSAVAYECPPATELAFWNARMNGVNAYTGHPVVPLCFQAEFFPILTGTAVDGKTMSPLFINAPQREIFPDAEAIPSEDVLLDWLRAHDIQFVYEDAEHPNTMLPSAIVIARDGDYSLSRIP